MVVECGSLAFLYDNAACCCGCAVGYGRKPARCRTHWVGFFLLCQTPPYLCDRLFCRDDWGLPIVPEKCTPRSPIALYGGIAVSAFDTVCGE